MTKGIEGVRALMAGAIDIDMPEGLLGPDYADDNADDRFIDGGDLPPPPPDESDVPPERECALLALNDTGNGQRFIRYFGDDVRWVPTLGWHVWTGTHYALDKHKVLIRPLAQKLGEKIASEIPWLQLEDWQMEAIGKERDLRERYAELSSTVGEDGKRAAETETEMEEVQTKLKAIADIKKVLANVRKAHRNFARTSGNTGKIDAALTEAAPHLTIPHEDLDAEPLAVNCQSGTLRFSVDVDPETGTRTAQWKIDAHNRADQISRIIDAQYRHDAACPQFLKFINRVQPSQEMRRYIQRWLGLSLTGLPVQAIMFWYGDGANGKSVLAELMARMLGSYSASIRIEALTGNHTASGNQATPELVYLVNTRFVRATEPKEGAELQDSLIKSVTSGENIMVRANFGEFFPFKPFFKLTISGNHKPEIRSTDHGIWRRVKVVPWEVIIPDDEKDEELIDKLYEERDGIFQWLIDGLVEYLEIGLSEPDKVTSATKEYKEDSDPIGSFISSCCLCTGDDRDRITARDLIFAFGFWLECRGETRWSDRRVANRLKDKANRWKSPRDGRAYGVVKSSGVPTYLGIKFDDAFGPRLRAAIRDKDGRPLVGRDDD